MEAVNNVI